MTATKTQARRDIRVLRVRPADAAKVTDRATSLRQLILECEGMYPGIRRWLNDKVFPGIRSGERSAFIALADGLPVASAVLKRGQRTKFCHVRLRDSAQDIHLGETFFALMAMEARHGAQEIHFTLPESLWYSEQPFFQAFGFRSALPAGTQYRLFDQELHCSAPFNAVWQAVLEKVPKITSSFTVVGRPLGAQLLMSIRAELAERIMTGRKTIEVRRRFSGRWKGSQITFVATEPHSALVGEATIRDVICGRPDVLWAEFGSGVGCSREEYDSYVRGSNQVSFIVLRDIRPFVSPVPLAQLGHLIADSLHTPQSFCTVESEGPWAKALALAGMLHAHLAPVSDGYEPFGLSPTFAQRQPGHR